MEALKARLTAMVGQLFSKSPFAGAINGRAFNTPDCNGAPQLTVQRQEGGAESWAILAFLVNTAKLHELDPQAYLADVLGAHRLQTDQEPPAARASGLELEGCLGTYPKGHRMSRRRHGASSATAATMPLQELERWLQERAERRHVATSIAMPDGYVAAIVAGRLAQALPLSFVVGLKIVYDIVLLFSFRHLRPAGEDQG